MVSQNQYNVLRQPTRNLNIKIDLINENDIIVGSFEGITVDGNITLDGNSTYRRSGTITMVFDKKYNILPSPSSKIWFNKRIGIYIGVKNYFDEIVWFNMGRFAISEIDLNFSSSEKTMSCQLSDYMAFLDGALSGILSHKTVIPEGIPISEAIKSILNGLVKISIESVKIEDEELVLPYKIEKEAGTTMYDLIKEILQIYMGWDFSFDENGVFVVEKIRDRKNDPVVEVFDGTDKDFTLTSNSRMDFKNVRNSIWVWGRQLNNGTKIKWVYRNRWARQSYFDLNVLTDIQIGDICHIENEKKSYMYNGETWELLNFNTVPIFCVEKIGEKIHTYSDDKIFDDIQAKMRCEYELQQKSNMAEVINFSIVPLYYLKPQQKININIEDLVRDDYIITSISIPLNIDSAMNIQATKLYY